MSSPLDPQLNLKHQLPAVGDISEVKDAQGKITKETFVSYQGRMYRAVAPFDKNVSLTKQQEEFAFATCAKAVDSVAKEVGLKLGDRLAFDARRGEVTVKEENGGERVLKLTKLHELRETYHELRSQKSRDKKAEASLLKQITVLENVFKAAKEVAVFQGKVTFESIPAPPPPLDDVPPPPPPLPKDPLSLQEKDVPPPPPPPQTSTMNGITINHQVDLPPPPPDDDVPPPPPKEAPPPPPPLPKDPLSLQEKDVPPPPPPPQTSTMNGITINHQVDLPPPPPDDAPPPPPNTPPPSDDAPPPPPNTPPPSDDAPPPPPNTPPPSDDAPPPPPNTPPPSDDVPPPPPKEAPPPPPDDAPLPPSAKEASKDKPALATNQGAESARKTGISNDMDKETKAQMQLSGSSKEVYTFEIRNFSNYSKILSVGDKFYANSEDFLKGIPKKDQEHVTYVLDRFFTQTAKLKDCSKNLLKDLMKAKGDPEKTAQVFIDHQKRLVDVYKDVGEIQNEYNNLRQKLGENAFNDLEKRLTQATGDKTQFNSLAILPTQIGPRYKLLLETMQKNFIGVHKNESTIIKKGLSAASEVPRHVNAKLAAPALLANLPNVIKTFASQLKKANGMTDPVKREASFNAIAKEQMKILGDMKAIPKSVRPQGFEGALQQVESTLVQLDAASSGRLNKLAQKLPIDPVALKGFLEAIGSSITPLPLSTKPPLEALAYYREELAKGEKAFLLLSQNKQLSLKEAFELKKAAASIVRYSDAINQVTEDRKAFLEERRRSSTPPKK